MQTTWMRRGTVSGRVALLLRSAEIQPPSHDLFDWFLPPRNPIPPLLLLRGGYRLERQHCVASAKVPCCRSMLRDIGPLRFRRFKCGGAARQSQALSWPACLSGGAVGCTVPCGSRLGLSWHRGPAIPSRSAPLAQLPLQVTACEPPCTPALAAAQLHVATTLACQRDTLILSSPTLSALPLLSALRYTQLSTFISSPLLSVSPLVSVLSFLAHTSLHPGPTRLSLHSFNEAACTALMCAVGQLWNWGSLCSAR